MPDPGTIPFQRPSLPPTAEIDRYLDLSRSERWFSNGGPCWHLLRERLGERVGSYCVPVANGTLGLMAALAALRDGDSIGSHEGAIVMPSFTFIASSQAAAWARLQPRLCDIDASHWHLDPDQLEHELASDERPAAALAVSAFGTPPPPEIRTRWEAACRDAGVPLIVDSAAGFGAIAEDGVPIGAQGNVEVVSFHATKPFAIGEGGAVFTRDRVLCERLERAVNFGLGPQRKVEQAHGLNAKMSELHAATALAMLDRLDTVLEQRRAAATTIRAAADAAISWQSGCERSTWQFLPLAVPNPERRRLLVEACRERIEVRVYYEPLHRLTPERVVVGAGGLERTEALCERVLCLPMANDLSSAERETIAAVLSSA